jgi:hypothetical protein
MKATNQERFTKGGQVMLQRDPDFVSGAFGRFYEFEVQL